MALLPRPPITDPFMRRAMKLVDWGFVRIVQTGIDRHAWQLTEKGWACLCASAEAPIKRPARRIPINRG